MKNENWGMRRFHHSAFIVLHLSRLFQIVAAINDAGVEEGEGFLGFDGRDALPRVLADRQVGPTCGS